MSNRVYQIKITLKIITPEIWRRFLVDPGILLVDLHKVIQTIMGWTNSHLHHFIKDKVLYCVPEKDDKADSAFSLKDYSNITLGDTLLKNENDAMIYEYDFGDFWEHDIVLEKILNNDEDKFYPICLDGKRNCPPEECGGSEAYEKMLKIVNDPKHKNYKKVMEWLGDYYDPEYFEIDETNIMLKEDDYGCPLYMEM